MEMVGWEIAVGQWGWVKQCQIWRRDCEIGQGDHMAGLRFKFGQYLNLNLLRGLGSGILLNLIPEPQVQNQVQTGFRRFRNQTVAILSSPNHSGTHRGM